MVFAKAELIFVADLTIQSTLQCKMIPAHLPCSAGRSSISRTPNDERSVPGLEHKTSASMGGGDVCKIVYI